jgi:transposase
MRETRKKLTAAVQAAGTTVTEVFGVGPVIAATVIGGVRGVSRFASRDHFAACNGTARSCCEMARRYRSRTLGP